MKLINFFFKRVDDSFSKEAFMKNLTGKSSYEIDFDKIKISKSGNIEMKEPKRPEIETVKEGNEKSVAEFTECIRKRNHKWHINDLVEKLKKKVKKEIEDYES